MQHQPLSGLTVLVIVVMSAVWTYRQTAGEDLVPAATVPSPEAARLSLYSWSNRCLREGLSRARKEAAEAKRAADVAKIDKNKARKHLPLAVELAIRVTERRCRADSRRRNDACRPPCLVAPLRKQVCGLRSERDEYAAVADRLKKDIQRLKAANIAAAKTSAEEMATARAAAARALRDVRVER